MEQLEATRCFIVTSYGRTATTWLAGILNNHPDIMCSHGPVLPQRYFLVKPSLSDVHDTIHDFFTVSVDRHYDEFERIATVRACGNVHGYALDWLEAHFRKNPSRRNYVLINMTRHPVPRIDSLVHAWTQQAAQSPGLMGILQDMHAQDYWKAACHMITALYPGLLEETGPWIFVTALLKTLTTDAVELSMDRCPHFTMESLTENPEDLHRLVTLILPNADWKLTEELFARSPRVNQSSKKEKTVDDVYAHWDSWQRDLFIQVPRFCSLDLPTLYGPIGYNLRSFIE